MFKKSMLKSLIERLYITLFNDLMLRHQTYWKPIEIDRKKWTEPRYFHQN
jgi:hypothetical protein